MLLSTAGTQTSHAAMSESAEQSQPNHLETPLGQHTAQRRWENTDFLVMELIRITRVRVVCMVPTHNVEPHKSSVRYHGIYRISGKNQQRNMASSTPLSFCKQQDCPAKQPELRNVENKIAASLTEVISGHVWGKAAQSSTCMHTQAQL